MFYLTFQIMTTIAYRILKFESMIKKPIVVSHTFFTFITYSRINSFAYTTSVIIQHLQYLIFKKIFIKIICHLFVSNFTIYLQVIFVFVYKLRVNRNDCKRFLFYISSDTFKPWKLDRLYYHMFLFWFLYIYHQRLAKHLIQY